MRLVCPTAFKGTRSPLEAARFLATPGDRLLPLSDGGDGFLECLHAAFGGTWHRGEFPNALGEPAVCSWLELPDGTQAVESAQVIGLAGLGRLDPWKASSLGLGLLLQHLRNAPRIWVGLGGTATLDGGKDWPSLTLPPTVAFCDVWTDLAGAIARFGPQKGVQPEDQRAFTTRLLDLGLPRGPHTGAAGGLGGKLAALGATLVPGGESLLDAVNFEDRCQGCESVLTGEGRLDATTLEGKLPMVVAQRARALGIPVFGHFGSRGEGWEQASVLFEEAWFEEG